METHEYEKKYIFDKAPDKKKDYLGGGGFGQVFKALIKGTDERRAVKIIDKNKIREDYKSENYRYPTDEEIKPYFDDLKDEIKYMKTMEGENEDNENTVKFWEFFEYNDIFVIVMEYCNMSLLDYFATRETFTVEEIRDLLTQLNNSFKIMNANRIAHRDLSLDNILIKYRNNDKKNIIYKLTDYGASKKLLTLSKKFSTKIGKLDFMAPEILNITKSMHQDQSEKDNKDKEKYDEECDLWSLGIIIHILFFRKNPFSGDTETAVKSKINILQKRGIGDTKDELLNDLLLRLLERDPTKRIKWKEYFEHPFFNNYKKSSSFVLISITVGKNDKKGSEFRDIYFLDNKPNMEGKTPLYKENEEIKNLTDNDVELYINNVKKQQFSKYFKPDKEGPYEIKIIFKKKIKDCSFMFSGCDNIKKIDLSSFDSSDVTNMYYMFGKCYYLKEIKFDNLNVKNVTDMSYMFNHCSELEKIEFPKPFNTKKVTNIEFMFHNCYELNNISFGDFNTDNVKTMKGLFGKCYKLKKIDINTFNTNKVIDMSYMFDKCTQLEELIINPKTFISKDIKNMSRMFDECNSLKNINLSSLKTEKVAFLNFMFNKCENIKSIDLSNVAILDNTNLVHMFDGCSNLEKLDLSSLKIGDNNKTDNMFDEMTKIKEIRVNENSIKSFKSTFKDIETKFIAN